MLNHKCSIFFISHILVYSCPEYGVLTCQGNLIGKKKKSWRWHLISRLSHVTVILLKDLFTLSDFIDTRKGSGSMNKQVKVASPVELLQYWHLHVRDSLPRLTTLQCSQSSVNRKPRDTPVFHNRSSKCLYLAVIFSLIFYTNFNF